MQIRHEIPALRIKGAYKGIPKVGIEVKVGSERYLAKTCSSYMGEDTYF